MATAIECMKLGCVGFLLPFMFVFFPGILDVDSMRFDDLLGITLLLAATLMIRAAFYGNLFGRLMIWERSLLALGTVSFVFYLFDHTMWWLGMIGPCLLIIVIVWKLVGSSHSIVDNVSKPKGRYS